MSTGLISLAAGVLIGLMYAVLKVRSPAPPALALIGLLGMLAGAAFCHNFGLASSGTGTTPAGRLMCAACIAVLFVIGFSCKRKSDK